MEDIFKDLRTENKIQVQIKNPITKLSKSFTLKNMGVDEAYDYFLFYGKMLENNSGTFTFKTIKEDKNEKTID